MSGISKGNTHRGFSAVTLVTMLAALAALLAVVQVLAPASASAMSKIEDKVPDLPPIERMPELPPVPSLPSVPSAPSDPSTPAPPPSSGTQTPGQAPSGSSPGGSVVIITGYGGMPGAPDGSGGGGWRVFPKRGSGKSRGSATMSQRAAVRAQVRRARACAKHNTYRRCWLGYEIYDGIDDPANLTFGKLENAFLARCTLYYLDWDDTEAAVEACSRVLDAILAAPDSPMVAFCQANFQQVLGLPFAPSSEACQAHFSMSRPWPPINPGDGSPEQADLEDNYLHICIDEKHYSRYACENAMAISRRLPH